MSISVRKISIIVLLSYISISLTSHIYKFPGYWALTEFNLINRYSLNSRAIFQEKLDDRILKLDQYRWINENLEVEAWFIAAYICIFQIGVFIELEWLMW